GHPRHYDTVREEIVVGRPLPRTVHVYTIPRHRDYVYAYVNERRVLVEPRPPRGGRSIEDWSTPDCVVGERPRPLPGLFSCGTNRPSRRPVDNSCRKSVEAAGVTRQSCDSRGGREPTH